MSESQTSRTRIITWEDPGATIQMGKRISGLEYMTALQKGDLPPSPIAVLMGMWVAEVSEGRVVFALDPEEFHYNPLGTMHGGVIATLLDSALGCTIHTMLPAGTGYTTLELKVNYLKSVTVRTGTLSCEGNVIHMGGSTATAEGRLTGPDGKLYAHATTTCMIFRPERQRREQG